MIVGTGIDIVEIARFRKVVERLKDRFISRVFTPEEQQFCQKHRDPIPHFAARLAAKEALFKALGTGWAKGVTWLDVEVRRLRQDPPLMVLRGEAGRISANKGTQSVYLSLSHSDDSAVALVVLER
jgi:holo-[acyl-carrier protein] synthase